MLTNSEQEIYELLVAMTESNKIKWVIKECLYIAKTPFYSVEVLKTDTISSLLFTNVIIKQQNNYIFNFPVVAYQNTLLLAIQKQLERLKTSAEQKDCLKYFRNLNGV